MNYRIILNEDGSFHRLLPCADAHWSRLGCYDTEEEAVRAATFLFGGDTWAIRWSDHGWHYIVPPGEASVPSWA